MLENIASSFNELDSVLSVEISEDLLLVDVKSGDRTYSLELSLGESYPEELPKVQLRSAHQYGHLPHVCWKGTVCYNDGEGLSIDIDRPIDVAIYSLQSAIGVLPCSNAVDLTEFYDEYEGYWNQQDGIVTTQLFFEPGSETSEIRVFQDKRGTPVSMLSSRGSDNPDPIYSYAKGINIGKTLQRGYYLPLSRNVAPPLPGEKIDTRFLEEVVSALSDKNRQIWDVIVGKKGLPKRLTLLISQPRPSGGRSLIGVTLSAPAVRGWLNGAEQSSSITPLGIRRHTKKYLQDRGGLGYYPENKKIAILGCGALGSRISELCLMSGFTNLTLIDGQSLSEENLFRHLLGSQFIGVNKANALSQYFTCRFPGISVTPVPEHKEDIGALMEEHDVLVVAIGNPTHERQISRKYRELKSASPTALVTTWLEAAGVGGHAILEVEGAMGCINCLYHKDSTPRLSSLTSLIEPGQAVTKNLTGCGGSFVPYGAIHAVKTATMVVEQLLNFLQEEQLASNYVYWSSDINGQATALKMTPWFDDSLLPGAEQQIRPIFDQGCPVCRM